MKFPHIFNRFSITRRKLIKSIFNGAALSLLPTAALFRGKSAYAQSVFSGIEEQQITIMVCDIIPDDTAPGAPQTGTPLYLINYFSGLDSSIISNIQSALYAINSISNNLYGIDLVNCNLSQREFIYGIVKTDPLLSPFWFNLRSLTVFHFYSQPLGYKQAGLPGPSVDDERFFNADMHSINLCSTEGTTPHKHKRGHTCTM